MKMKMIKVSPSLHKYLMDNKGNESIGKFISRLVDGSRVSQGQPTELKDILTGVRQVIREELRGVVGH